MNRMKIVAQDTLMKQIKSGSFWFMILFPIIMMGISMAIGYFASSSGNDMAVIADESIAPYFENNPDYDFRIISEDELDKLLDDKEISSYAKVKNDNGLITADYMSGSSSMSQRLTLQSILGQIQTDINAQKADLSQEQVKALGKMPVDRKSVV